MIELQVKSSDLPKVKRRMKRIFKKMENTKPLMRHLSIFLDQWVQKNFKSQGGKVGGWDKLKAGGRWKGTGKYRKFDASASILQDTGDLRKSFMPFYNKGDAGIGSDLPYAPNHNFGKGSLPKRRMIPEDREVIGPIMKKVDTFVKQSLKT